MKNVTPFQMVETKTHQQCSENPPNLASFDIAIKLLIEHYLTSTYQVGQVEFVKHME